MTEQYLRAVKCIFALLLLVAYMRGAAFAEFVVHPSIIVGEEYNDNIFLQNRDPQADYITHLVPALNVQYQSSLLTWNGNYTLEYLHFARNDQRTETRHTVNSRIFIEAVPQTVYFEGIHVFRRVSLSVVTDFTQQSPTALQVDQNVLTLHPYLVLLRARNTVLHYGHRLIETRYSNGLGIDRTQNVDYVEATTMVSSRVTSTVGIRQTREQNNVNDFVQSDLYAGIRYLYGEFSSLYGQAVRSRHSFDISGNTDETRVFGGISHVIAPYTFALDSGVTYWQDPLRVATREDYYRASISRTTDRSSLSIARGWHKYVNMTTNTVRSIVQDGQVDYLYRLTPRMTGTIRGRYQNIEDVALSYQTHISESAIRLDYRLTENTTLSTAYSYIRSYAPGILLGNYIVNRGLIELSMLF